MRTTGAPAPFAAVMDSEACEVRGPDPSGLRRSVDAAGPGDGRRVRDARVAGRPGCPTDPTGRCAAEAGFTADPAALGAS
ncbi:hypothetical protein [Kitasatospora cheerisanensis]|uniref:hypothetical protein n=1 Tax=Kitasatospora cheerisanensis TaxID=81942 RepID=UPI0012EDD9FF|nr:hypothetical protein [Kitasatospora cheerisanensis]